MRRKRESKNSGLFVHWPVIVLGSVLIALFSTLAYRASHSAPPSHSSNVLIQKAGDSIRPSIEHRTAGVFLNSPLDRTR